MSSIFISHSSQDNETAERIKQRLEKNGHAVFLDFDLKHGIAAGSDWERELYRHLRACRAVIVLCSPDSMGSKWCFVEMTHARALGKPLFPVKIAECELEGVLTDRQVVDFTAGEETAFQLLESGLLAAGLDPADTFDWDPRRSPYPGLLAFQERDAAVFFGRDREIGEGLELVNRVRHLGDTSLVMVLGASGTGKSSLVRAGLIPRLKRDRERWLVVGPVRPRNEPVAELAARLVAAGEEFGWERSSGEIEVQLRQEMEGAPPGGSSPPDGSPLLQMATELRRRSGRDQARVLLVVDQFEELLGDGGSEAEGLLALLRAAADRPASPLVILGTMRSDFLGLFQRSPALRGLRYESLSLGPMLREQVAEVIRGPAGVAGIELGPGLVETLVDDAGGGESLPLLAFALWRLHEECGDDKLLELREYREKLGGLDRAVAQAADDLLEAERRSGRYDTDRERQLRAALLRMVRPTEGGGFARRSAPWKRLPEEVHPLLEKFVTARLLVSGGDGEARRLEVAHEALFDSWGVLRHWLRESAEALRLHQEIHADARRWQEATGSADRRPEDLLWRGGRLSRARELEAGEDLDLEALEEQFIEASWEAERAAARAEEARRQGELRRARRFAFGVSLALLAAVTLGVVAWFSRRAAVEAGERAKENLLVANYNLAGALEQKASAALAEAAETDADSSFQDAWLYTLAALDLELPSERSLPTSVGRLADLSLRQRALAPPDSRSGEEVKALALSSAGEYLAVQWEQGRIRLWDLTTGATRASFGSGSQTVNYELAFHPEQPLLAAVAASYLQTNQIELWDLSDVERPRLAAVLAEYDDGFAGLDFSIDGRYLRGGPLTWDLSSPSEPRLADSGALSGVSWLSGASRAAVDRTASLARLCSGARMCAGSADGRRVASASRDDRSIRLWDTTDAGAPKELAAYVEPLAEASSTPSALISVMSGHSKLVTGVTFSSDGRRLASVSWDESVRLWDVSDPSRPEGGAVLRGFDSGNAVAFDPRGGTLVAGVLGAVENWALEDPEPPRRGSPLDTPIYGVWSLAFTPNGRYLVLGGDDRPEVWDVTDWGRPSQLAKLDRSGMVALSPDGATLAVSGGRSVGLYDVSDPGQRPRRLGEIQSEQSTDLGLAFDPRGKLLAASRQDGSLLLVDVGRREAPRPLAAISGHSKRVWTVAFHPTQPVLASGSEDGTIRLLDVSNPARPQHRLTLQAGGGPVRSVAFHPGGRMLASADQAVRLWDVPMALKEAEGVAEEAEEFEVHAVAFDESGRLMASSESSALRFWDVSDPSQPTPLVRADHNRPVTSIAFRPGSRTVATGSFDPYLRLWDYSDAANPRLVQRLRISEGEDDTYVDSLAFDPAGKLLAAGSSYKKLVLWSLSASEPERLAVNLEHNDNVFAVAFSPGGATLATGSRDRSLRLWDVSGPAGLKLLSKVPHRHWVRAVAFAPGGQLLASGSHDRTLRLFDVSDPRQPVELRDISGDFGAVTSIAFRLDGGVLAFGSTDGTIRLWDVSKPERARELIALRRGARDAPTIYSVAFRAGGAYLASGSGEPGETILWELGSVNDYLEQGRLAPSFRRFRERSFRYLPARLEGGVIDKGEPPLFMAGVDGYVFPGAQVAAPPPE